MAILDIVVLIPIFGNSTTCFHTEYTSFPKCWGCNLVVLDIVVLRPIFGKAIPVFILCTHELTEVLGVYFGSAGYCGAKTNIWH